MHEKGTLGAEMNIDVKISVVIPVFNVEKYIKRCIESILNQTFSEYEVILVDDGSTDNSGKLCDAFQKENSIIRVFHKENGGLGDARNFGVLKASSNWVVFVDSDDYVSENYLSDLWAAKEKYDADMVIGNIARVNEQSEMLSQTGYGIEKQLNSAQAFFEIYICKRAEYSSYSKLIKKSTLMKYPFPKGYFEDFATTYLFLFDCDNVVIENNTPGYFYVQREGSIINSILKKQHFRCYDICKEITAFIDSTWPRYSKYLSVVYQGQTVQMLNKQQMTEEQYRKIFKMYQGQYKKTAFQILISTRIPLKIKVYRLLLCTNYIVYRFVQSRVS